MVGRPTRVRRQCSEDGEWELAEAPPGPELEGLVRGYVGFVETSVTPLRRREVPSGTCVLIVNFGVPLEVGVPGRSTTAHAEGFVARLSELPATTAFSGTSAGVQVDFSPLGLHLFCSLAIDELPPPRSASKSFSALRAGGWPRLWRRRRTGSRASIFSTPRSIAASPPQGRRRRASSGRGEHSRRVPGGSRSAA